MSIIEQLRDAAKWTRDGKAGGETFVGPELLETAADEIERLRIELRSLVNACEGGSMGTVYSLERALPFARAALNE